MSERCPRCRRECYTFKNLTANVCLGWTSPACLRLMLERCLRAERIAREALTLTGSIEVGGTYGPYVALRIAELREELERP